MHLKSALFFAAAAVLVNAQETPSPTPSSTGGLSQCILDCVNPAATDNGCSSFADLGCVCTNQGFQNDALACLQSSCSQEEVQAALNLQQTQCAAFTSGSSIFSSLSSAGSSVFSSLSSGASSVASSLSSEFSSRASSISSRISTATAGPTSSASSSSAAIAPATFAPGVLLTVAFGAVGIVAGALLV